MAGCSICGGKTLARGWCARHYATWCRHGDPTVRTRAAPGEPTAWLRSTLTRDSDECIEWPFRSKYKNGYGSIFHNGKLTGAHRLMCKLAHGAPPYATSHAAHSCGNRLCVNPKHLRWATPKENEGDKIAAGGGARGEKNPSAKLSEAEVLEIYSLKGMAPQYAIAKKYGITREAVREIHNNRNWGWLTTTRQEEAA